MTKAFRFSSARSLEEYGNTGYGLALVVLTAGMWGLEMLAGAMPVLGAGLASVRDTLKQILTLAFPSSTPVLRYLISLPALTAFSLVAAGIYKPWRVRFGRAFANGFLAVAGALLGMTDFLFRRRGAAAIVLIVLGVLLPAGFMRQRNIEREQALTAQAYARWVSTLSGFIDSTSLAAEEQVRAQRLMTEWAATKVGPLHPVAAELIATLQLLYGVDAKRSWDDRIELVAKREPKPCLFGTPDATVLRAHTIVLARARLRRALDNRCVSAEEIDAASEMFGRASGGFEKSVAYGMVPLFRCGMDHLLLKGARTATLKLCRSAVECAGGALTQSAPDQSDDSRECQTVELKRRNNRLDVLIRLAVNFDQLGAMLLPEARTKDVLGREILAAQTSLLQCGQLYRLRESVAFRTLAEAKAASFDLASGVDSTALTPTTRGLVEESARWLLTAQLLAPHADSDWDMAPFRNMLKQPDAKQTFITILGGELAEAVCKSLQ